MSKMVNTVAAPADPARVEVPLAQAARRTGLADSAGGMAALCERRELMVTPTVHGRARVDLRLFGGGAAPLLLAQVAVLETGSL